MYTNLHVHRKYIPLLVLLIITSARLTAQTDADGIMMQKNLFCAGGTYSHSAWKNYWEGTTKRDNANMGTVSSNAVMIMGNYGITDKLNIIFGLPYIKTKASAGQLAGQKGLQDLSLFAKWVAKSKHIKGGTLNGIVIGGVSMPVSKYTPDLLPLSIGLQSKTALLKLMADYERKHFTLTASGAYQYRSNVTLDRNTYYTTEMHYSNKVKMPDMFHANIRAGYRSMTWIAEAVFEKMNTLGGYDISRNNMPFVSNNMDATRLGVHVKYDTDFINGLSFVADGGTTISGRNMGQSSFWNAGIFYIMDFGKKEKPSKTEEKSK